MSALIDSSSISAAQFSNCYTFTSSVLDCIFIFLKTAITKNDTLEKKRKKKTHAHKIIKETIGQICNMLQTIQVWAHESYDQTLKGKQNTRNAINV